MTRNCVTFGFYMCTWLTALVRIAKLWCFLWSAPEKKNGWATNQDAVDLRPHCANYDATVMTCKSLLCTEYNHHHNDVAWASEIIGDSPVWLTVCSGVHKENIKCLRFCSFVKGIRRWSGDSSHKGPFIKREIFPCHGFILINIFLVGHRNKTRPYSRETLGYSIIADRSAKTKWDLLLWGNFLIRTYLNFVSFLK